MTHRDLVNFLIKSGWSEFKSSPKFSFFKPPADMGFEPSFSFPVPIDASTSDYEQALEFASKTLASYYDKEPNELIYDVSNYMEILKSNAMYFKLESDEVTFNKTLGIDDITNFLNNLNKSYLNFLQVDFFKSFRERLDDRARAKVYKHVEKFSGLRLVGLEFKSFSVGVSADTLMGNERVEIPDVIEWRRTILPQYKNEVINFDFMSGMAIESLLEKYSDIERRLIFKPLIDSINNDDYTISLTTPSFEHKKRLPRLPKSTIERILPPVDRTDDVDTIEVVQFIMPISSKKKKVTINTDNIGVDLFAVQKSEFNFEVSAFFAGKDQIKLNEPLKVDVQVFPLEKSFYVSSGELIQFYTNDFNSIQKDFLSNLAALYAKYVELQSKDGERNQEEREIIMFFDGKVS